MTISIIVSLVSPRNSLQIVTCICANEISKGKAWKNDRVIDSHFQCYLRFVFVSYASLFKCNVLMSFLAMLLGF